MSIVGFSVFVPAPVGKIGLESQVRAIYCPQTPLLVRYLADFSVYGLEILVGIRTVIVFVLVVPTGLSLGRGKSSLILLLPGFTTIMSISTLSVFSLRISIQQGLSRL